MASLAVGQHTDQRMFLPNLRPNEKKISKKASSGVKSPMRAVSTQSRVRDAGAAVSGPRASLNHPNLPGHCGATGNAVGMSSAADRVQEPRNSRGVVAEGSCSKCGDSSRTMLTVAEDAKLASQNKTRKDRDNGNPRRPTRSTDKSDGDTSCARVCSTEKNPAKDTKASKSNGHAHLSRPGGKRSSQITVHQHLDFRSLGDEHAGWPLSSRMPVLTQGRSGVVKMMRNDPPRREAWSIFSQEDPRVKPEKGEGHLFAPTAVAQDWCDACNRQVSDQSLKCKNCSYTCHLECERLVQLDCNQSNKQSASPPQRTSDPAPQGQNVTQEEAEKPKSLSKEEVRVQIEEYNSKVSENGMKLSPDGTYTGFIKVHLKLRRPVTVPVEVRPSGGGARPGAEGCDRRTSFYLPLDAVKQLHVSSGTTASEVVQGLLAKFMVLDNPRKFALYRQTHRHGQDLFQKLPVSEQPLRLRLLSGPDPEQLTFVLKENETGEVEWHAFSVPELHNFLAILQKEEQERERQLRERYAAYRQRLELALQGARGAPG
ncbi:ras association domain-containing protein 5 isoform X1 [Conger conger]|uniref:ras association domain-containing protein 5 isoform X1 n=1 Tax=Conger conger TaxID=82655 RepID=UPI002A5983E2|nr:ras association domain-containing protein 5 isoform X1 [Conger conger]